MFPRLDRPLLFRAAVLVLGSGAAGLGANALRPAGVAILSFAPPTTCTAEAGGSESPIVELGPREASSLCGRAGVVFADTRAAARFEEGHVADAVHLPCDASELGAQAAIAHLSPAQTVIVYGDSSDDGRAVAESLRRRGLRGDLRVLRGGFTAWEHDGLACASGPARSEAASGSSSRAPSSSTGGGPAETVAGSTHTP